MNRNELVDWINFDRMAVERWLLARSQSNALSLIGTYEQSKAH